LGDVLSRERGGSGPLVRLVAAGAVKDGRGHVSRALALADALCQAGADVELELIRGQLTALERSRISGWPVRLLDSGASERNDHALVILDLPDSAEALNRFEPDRLVVFDDRAVFGGRAAFVIQPSLPSWEGPGTARRVLAGYGYVPLADEFGQLRARLADRAPARTGTLPRVLVCFGGSDPDDALGRIGPGLVADPRWTAEVVVGAGYRGAADAWWIPPIRDPADLPERLAAADLAILGAGTMKFEAACLGRPAVLLAVADDQLAVAPVYAATGAAAYLGDARSIDPGPVRTAVAGLLADEPGRAAMAGVAHRLVDGEGAGRIAEAVLALAAGVR